ncbi:diaminopropionate ammonia-lyase [Chitinasiproducens palmae]|uniref:Diaminopropionate ammonia-lyase n=1 Tax=Chitinasiproducens palmae TaxID=1770053 RepID=A0A1H2PR62_9BURK|nr:diaminopropionate ammonia-lyase [Chitinasiproducens palmae]SDV48955.1 diaminopropionate ammonia-lyase [Chitinasiproducens palmae]
MFFANPRALRTAYPDQLKSLLNVATADEDARWLARWDGIAPHATPLHTLTALAAALGIARLDVKDESVRSSLGSFKALGAPIALVREVLRRHPALEPTDVLRGGYADTLRDFTVISATDGNHGRALAAAARSAGCRCVIVLHAQVSGERESAIAAQGAQIVRVAGNYDASVEEAARLAASNGWQVVSDTSYEGYESIPRDVMQGYGVIAAEIEAARPSERYTHVILQGGVGGLAAGVISYLWERHGERRPCFIVVEPRQADCLLQSAIHGCAAKATGSVDSIMAGLACGETSPLAWRFLETSVDCFVTVDDAQAVEAMCALAGGQGGDVPIVAGESGAAGLAGLYALRDDSAGWAAAGLNGQSRVLLVNSEGATAPAVYQKLVGIPADAVLQRQAQWLVRSGGWRQVPPLAALQTSRAGD